MTMKNKFTYKQLMQWDKNDLAHTILDYQYQIGRVNDSMFEFEGGALTVFELIQTIKKVI